MSEVKKKTFKLDIFSILSKLNSKDLNVWENLSEEEQKGFSAFIITRWMSGTDDAAQIMYLNELVNQNIFNNVGKRPEILAKLLAICGTGYSKRFQWIADSKAGAKESKLALTVVKDYFDYTTREAQSQLPFLSNDDIIELANELGWQDDEIKKLKKELK